jgi:hypothetical protein
MTELSGTLGGVGLPAIVRFLGGLQKTGRLRLSQDDWTGEICFESGAVTHAVLGSRKGVPALDGMLELFPEAAFAFESGTPGDGSAERTVVMQSEELQKHLDATAARVASGGRCLPHPDVVPAQTANDNEGEEPLPLDRGTLQTLLAVDGHRTVREIVAMRRSIESVWHLASLADVGLVQFRTDTSEASSTPTVITKAPLPVVEPPASPPRAPDQQASPPLLDPALQETLVAPLVPSVGTPRPETGSAPTVAHCPKLGFEDDPSNSFGRPTRMHRCFAESAPMPLSLDQQRELCLSDHFGTCPRLATAPTIPPAGRSPRPPVGGRRAEASTREDGRIVRLPFGARAAAADREDSRPGAGAPTPLRAPAPPARDETAAAAPPTPLRARAARPSAAQTAAVAATAATLQAAPVEAPREPAVKQPSRHEQARAAAQARDPFGDGRRRAGQIPIVAVAAAGAVVLLLAALAYLFLPQLFADNTVDTSLPNARLIEEGTPVTALVPPRATPGVNATAVPGSAADALSDPPTSAPDATAVPSPAAAGAGQPTMTTEQPAAAALFDERFTTNDANWPSTPQGLGQFTGGSYRMATRQTGESATIDAPFARVPADVQVTADFQKLGGPDGGGYGIIVRDQQQGVRDGSSQDGGYYVLEAGDKGEVGIWCRDGDHWVDLVPWQHADAVRPGTAPNELTVRAVGNTLSLLVNRTQVAARTDATLANGQVGLFVGGDGNQVAITRFTVQNP